MRERRHEMVKIDRNRAFRTWLAWMERALGTVDLAPFEAVRAIRARHYPDETERETVVLLKEAAGLHVIDIGDRVFVVTPESWRELEVIAAADREAN